MYRSKQISKRFTASQSQNFKVDFFPPQQKIRELPRKEAVLPNKFRSFIFYSIAGGVWASVTLIAFNYQRLTSPVIGTTLHSLRHSEQARGAIGENIIIKRRSKWWWPFGAYVGGDVDILHGNINVKYDVKGSKGDATVHFRSTRKNKRSPWSIEQWNLFPKDATLSEISLVSELVNDVSADLTEI